MVVEVEGFSGAGQAISTDVIEAALSVAQVRAERPEGVVGLPATAP